MKIGTKTKMLAALSAFQVVASVASASDIKKVMVAQDAEKIVICDVSQLDKAKTSNWPGLPEGTKPNASNEAILKKIDKDFAGGKYFDAYPHKLPELFSAGACVAVKK